VDYDYKSTQQKTIKKHINRLIKIGDYSIPTGMTQNLFLGLVSPDIKTLRERKYGLVLALLCVTLTGAAVEERLEPAVRKF
jgi:hypothetical protein